MISLFSYTTKKTEELGFDGLDCERGQYKVGGIFDFNDEDFEEEDAEVEEPVDWSTYSEIEEDNDE